MTTLKVTPEGVVDIDSGKRVGTIHLRECGDYYFRQSVFIEELTIDEADQVSYIMDTLNGQGED